MRRLRSLIFVLATTIIFASCGGSGVDNSLAPKDRLQGNWEIVKAEGGASEMNKGTIYTFEEGVMTTGGAATGKFTATDSTIVWDLGSMEMNYTFHFDENTLIIEPLNSGQKLFLEKK